MHRSPSQSLNQQFRTLGAIRALAFKFYWEALINDDEALLQTFFSYAEGVECIAQALGLEFKRQWLFTRRFELGDDLTEVMPAMLENILLEDKFSRQIRETFGKHYVFEFMLSQMIVVASIIRFFQHMDLRSVPSHRRPLIGGQRALAHEYLTAVGTILKQQQLLIRDLHDADFATRCESFSFFLLNEKQSLSRFAKLSDYTSDLLDHLIPHFNTIHDQLERAESLIADLKSCGRGRTAWRSYEEVCLKCIRFLFVPPFRKILVQARTANGCEVRDAVLPNNQFGGFWKLIKEEFDSKHVICEFKNLSRMSTKQDLNQLRLYLSKPTVGRFGLLFTRYGADAGFVAAQRHAYEQQRILVLLITDTILVRMLKARAFIGSADFILEDLKAEFEVTY